MKNNLWRKLLYWKHQVNTGCACQCMRSFLVIPTLQWRMVVHAWIIHMSTWRNLRVNCFTFFFSLPTRLVPEYVITASRNFPRLTSHHIIVFLWLSVSNLNSLPLSSPELLSPHLMAFKPSGPMSSWLALCSHNFVYHTAATLHLPDSSYKIRFKTHLCLEI